MPFTLEDFRDLLRLLEEHPELRAELRRLLLPEDWVALPAIIRELAEQVRALAEAQRRTEERVAGAEERLDQVEQRLDRVERRLARVESDVAALKGSDLERRYRERAPSYFSRLMRRLRVLSQEELAKRLDDALDGGEITREQRDAILESDIVAHGQWHEDDNWAYIVVEVSGSIEVEDVQRAAERAEMLSQTPSFGRAFPVVAGQRIAPEADRLAASLGVWKVIDGTMRPPTVPVEG